MSESSTQKPESMPRRAVHLLARVLAALSIVLILVMMVATVADVISRLVWPWR